MIARPNGLTYAKAGVDIDAGEALVEAIKPLAKSTRRPGAEASLGGFGAVFDLKAAGFNDPLIVSTTDGVGTKLRIAIDTGRHHGVGVDLVAIGAAEVAQALRRQIAVALGIERLGGGGEFVDVRGSAPPPALGQHNEEIFAELGLGQRKVS